MLGGGGSWVGSSRLAGGGSKYVRTTRFVSIGAGTSGTVTLPANSEVVLDDFGGATDAVVSQITSAKPNGSPAVTSANVLVAATFDASGNWTFSGTPSAYPVALIYRVRTLMSNLDSTATDIIGDVDIDASSPTYIAVKVGDGLVGTPSVAIASDPDTGLYSVGANVLGVTVGGVKAIEARKSDGGFGNTSLGGTASTSDAYPMYVLRNQDGETLVFIDNGNNAANTTAGFLSTVNGGTQGFQIAAYTAGSALADLANRAGIYTFGMDGFTIHGGTDIWFAVAGHAATNVQAKISATGLTLQNGSQLFVPKTITAAGTTGNQTIDKIAGTVNIAAGAAAVTVTNSTVTTSSIVLAVVRTADATLTFIKSVVPAAGSFVITCNANATAETSIGFFVVN